MRQLRQAGRMEVGGGGVPACRLHWGCGSVTPAEWINSDLNFEDGVDLVCDLLQGLPLAEASIDYIASHHALQEIPIYDQVRALTELRRVLKPGGVLRLGLPDLDRAIEAYRTGDAEFFAVADWETLSGNFVTHILWHNLTRTLLTYEFAHELLCQAGFRAVHRVAYLETVSPHPEIVELDGRERESFFVEAFK